jgi:hypothetical protein
MAVSSTSTKVCPYEPEEDGSEGDSVSGDPDAGMANATREVAFLLSVSSGGGFNMVENDFLESNCFATVPEPWQKDFLVSKLVGVSVSSGGGFSMVEKDLLLSNDDVCFEVGGLQKDFLVSKDGAAVGATEKDFLESYLDGFDVAAYMSLES